MAGKVLTKGLVGGDLLKAEDVQQYCRESMVVDNTGGSTDITLPVGYPVIFATSTLLLAAAVNTLTGITIEPHVIPAGTKKQIAVLARGPAVINTNVLPTADKAGTSFNMSTFQTALAALSPKFVLRTESTFQAEQDT